MKKLFLALTALFTLTTGANAMSYENAREQALFLTDKMAYELNLSPEQYDAAYEINLDYLMGVTTSDDVYSQYWECRNRDLSYVLLDWQYAAFCDALYFYRPLYWDAGFWHFRIYGRYPHRDWFYFDRPGCWLTYHGEHCWRHHAGPGYYHGRVFGTPATHNHSRSIERGMRDNWNGQGRRFENNSRGNSNRAGSNGGFNRGSSNNRGNSNNGGFNRGNNNDGNNGGFNRGNNNGSNDRSFNNNRGASNTGRSFSGTSRSSQNSTTTSQTRSHNSYSTPSRSSSGSGFSSTRSSSSSSSYSSPSRSSSGSSFGSSSSRGGSSSFGSSRSGGSSSFGGGSHSSSFGGGSHSSSSHGGGSHSFGGGGRH